MILGEGNSYFGVYQLEEIRKFSFLALAEGNSALTLVALIFKVENMASKFQLLIV
jgi:hypothetical protein